MIDYTFDGKSLKSRAGHVVATIAFDKIRDDKGHEVGHVLGQSIYDSHSHKIGSFDGRELRDSSGHKVATMDDIHKQISGSGGASLAALYLLFVR